MVDEKLEPLETTVNYFRVAILIVLCFTTMTFYGCETVSWFIRLAYSIDVEVIVAIVDDDTSLPIPDADVEILKYKGFGGEAKERQQSGPSGLITIQDKEEFFGPYLQQVSVKKEGYHENGENPSDLYVDYWKLDKLKTLKKKTTIRLKKIVNPTQLTQITGTFHEGDKAALLSDMHLNKVDYRINKMSYDPSTHKDTENVDFELTGIHIEVLKNDDRVRRGVAKIRFFGAGGIQEIPNYEDTDHRFMGWYIRFFGLENVILAPTEGYLSELILKSEKQYIAKLRDGVHFIKFTPLIDSPATIPTAVDQTTNIEKVLPYVKLGIFLQPAENRNLETTDVIKSPW